MTEKKTEVGVEEAAAAAARPATLEGDPNIDSNSSGDHRDPLHDEEDRLAADPALEPELAWKRDEARAEKLAKEDAKSGAKEQRGTQAIGATENRSAD